MATRQCSSPCATKKRRWRKPKRWRRRSGGASRFTACRSRSRTISTSPGLPTTAACPAFAYIAGAGRHRGGAAARGRRHRHRQDQSRPVRHRPGRRALALWRAAQSVRGDLIPGGSSSGSAVAVAAGLVPLALGTDTAGSGRVPAVLNNIVGLKPSLGLVSTAGVVPACRSLDCVSVFALTVDDAMAALQAMAGPDARRSLLARPAARRRCRVSRPAPARRAAQRPADLLRRRAAEQPMATAIARWTALGATTGRNRHRAVL